ncbi:MAG: putative metallopeptidase [archaeon]
MRYSYSSFWTEKARELAEKAGMKHINPGRISVIESNGSKTRRVIARIHSLGKAMQLGMNEEAFYVIELISERFNKLSEREKTETIVHELLHIPHSFAGGFRHHKPFVNKETVEKAMERLTYT